MRDDRFAKTSLEVARENIAALFSAFSAATQVSATTMAKVVAGDPAFIGRYKRVNLTFGTYDRVAGRFSKLWPADAPWPAGVPRPEPVDVPADLLALVTDRQTPQPAPRKTATLPGNAEWPADIPRPGAPSQTEKGDDNG